MSLSRFKCLVYEPQEWFRDCRQVLDGTRKRQIKEAGLCVTDTERLAFANRWLQPCQKEAEILGFLAWLKDIKPRTIVEIGVARGGTSYLMMNRVPGVRQYIGVAFFPLNRRLLRQLAPDSLRLDYACGSSRDPQAKEKVIRLLKGNPIDLLFIDGDHSYEGVKADWMNFSPLVRSGGWIALHDILPPECRPNGTAANGFAAEVDRFWCEVKSSHFTRTFIEENDQFGYGIGVVKLEG